MDVRGPWRRAVMWAGLATGEQGQLMFAGLLNCHQGTCELVLEP